MPLESCLVLYKQFPQKMLLHGCKQYAKHIFHQKYQIYLLHPFLFRNKEILLLAFLCLIVIKHHILLATNGFTNALTTKRSLWKNLKYAICIKKVNAQK